MGLIKIYYRGQQSMNQLLVRQEEVVSRVKGLVSNNNISTELSMLGEGISGHVFSIEDYAVKIFKENSKEKTDYRILSHLEQEPLFPKVIYHEDQNYMIVEKVKGLTVSQYLEQGGTITTKHKSQIDNLFEGLYRRKVVPSDLHLNNIMIDELDNIKVIDVGRFKFTREIDLSHLNKQKSELLKRIDMQLNHGSPFIDISINISIGDIHISFPSWGWGKAN